MERLLRRRKLMRMMRKFGLRFVAHFSFCSTLKTDDVRHSMHSIV